MVLNARRNINSEKNSESLMRFTPTTLRHLVGCSNHRAAGDCMVSKGQFVVGCILMCQIYDLIHSFQPQLPVER